MSNYTDPIGITYLLNSPVASVIGYTGSSTTLNIPSTIIYSSTTYSVTSIGVSAFQSSSLQSITIPNSVTSIGDSAFYLCTSLQSITFGQASQLITIGNLTFYICSSLQSITIPNSVTSIGNLAFYKCTNLQNIIFPQNSQLINIGSSAFSNCTGLQMINIPDSVTTINNLVFNNCTSLTSINIPSSVISIGNLAFAACTGIISVTFNQNSQLTNIGTGGFSNCTNLTSINIPNSVTSLSEALFQGCTSLTTISIPDSIITISISTFSNCTSLQMINIPNSVTTIDNLAFNNCTSLTSINIPANIMRVGYGAFINTNITTIQFDSGVNYNISFDTTILPSSLMTLSYNTYGLTYLSDSMQSLLNIFKILYPNIQITYLIPPPTGWYSINISIQNLAGGNSMLSYYFSLDTTSNLITGFYNYNNIGVNTLLPIPPSPYFNPSFTFNPIITTIPNPPYLSPADNMLDPTTLLFSYNAGINFVDTYLQSQNIEYFETQSTIFPLINPLFNIFSYNVGSGVQNGLWAYAGPSLALVGLNNLVLTNSITIQPISGPPSLPPISNVCFPSGTPISCDQGMIPIEKINCDFHTISNNKIVAITETISQDKYLVCFGKHSLGFNYPNAKTAMSKHHKLYYNGKMIETINFLDDFENVKKVKYNGEVLYNILLEKYGKVTVNNMICETLHPENLVAKIYTSNLDVDYKNQIIKEMNNSITKNKYFKYNEMVNIINDNSSQMNDYEDEEFMIQAIENYQDKSREKEQKIYKIEPNEKVFKKDKIFYLSGTDNLNLQNKVEKYAKRAKNTEIDISGIVEKKNLLNKATETKEQKEILKKEIKSLLQLDKNGTKTKTYKNNQTKRRNNTCRYRFLD